MQYLGVGHNLIEFVKIFMSKSFLFLKKKKNTMIF
jgi:hypothetical protein